MKAQFFIALLFCTTVGKPADLTFDAKDEDPYTKLATNLDPYANAVKHEQSIVAAYRASEIYQRIFPKLYGIIKPKRSNKDRKRPSLTKCERKHNRMHNV